MSKAKRLRKAASKQVIEFNSMTSHPEGQDTSLHVHQDKKLNWRLTIKERSDLTERQQVILETAADKHTRCVFIDGIWGSGKSYMAVLASLRLLNSGRADQILYIRNPVEATSTGKLGYLKGDMSEKMGPYCAPLHDKLAEMLPKPEVERLIKEGKVECVPLGFVRGRSWNCKAIIVDEASSMTWDDLMLLLSRCGEFTRIFFIGDSLNQNDIGSRAGFARMVNVFDDDDSKIHGIYTFELREVTDVVRSGFLRYVMTKTGVIRE